MWNRCAVATIIIAVALSRTGGAQPARTGRLPVLALPPNGPMTCSNQATTPELRRSGIVRILNVLDSANNRHLSLGVDATGAPKMFTASMSTHEVRRGEGESVTAFFSETGAVVQGSRTAYTMGTPARLSEDRRLGLLPTDTSQIKALVHALRQACHT